MSGMKIKIAAAANQLFAERGFAEPGVEAIREAAGVSIRTLYKHYPSREAMIVGALAHRHALYLEHLREGKPAQAGQRAVFHLFDRLESWMAQQGTRGCLFVQALASHPESAAIHAEVERNKQGVRAEIAGRLPASQRRLLPPLFLLHEGVTAAASNLGAAAACNQAKAVVRQLFAESSRTPPRRHAVSS
jgi:AcrR family transcriptional regulator